MTCNMSRWFFSKYTDNTYNGVTTWIRTFLKATPNDNLCVPESGIRLHKDIERYLKHDSVSNDTIEFRQFLSFVNDHDHLRPFFVEEPIEISDLKWRGIVDVVFVDEDEQFWLYDWKRSKQDMPSVIEFPTDNLSQMQPSLINAYILQLNIYRIILESEYDMKIHGMYIACFHPSLPSYRIVNISRLSHMLEMELVDLRLSEL